MNQINFPKVIFNQKEFLDALHGVYTLEASACRMKTESPIKREKPCEDTPIGSASGKFIMFTPN